jgi:hypothetical protein
VWCPCPSCASPGFVPTVINDTSRKDGGKGGKKAAPLLNCPGHSSSPQASEVFSEHLFHRPHVEDDALRPPAGDQLQADWRGLIETEPHTGPRRECELESVQKGLSKRVAGRGPCSGEVGAVISGSSTTASTVDHGAKAGCQ